MEKELFVFQTQIEQKFRKSQINRKFVFPRVSTQAETSEAPSRLQQESNQMNMVARPRSEQVNWNAEMKHSPLKRQEKGVILQHQ